MLDVRSLSAEQGGVDFRWLSINHMDIFLQNLLKKNMNQLTKLPAVTLASRASI